MMKTLFFTILVTLIVWSCQEVRPVETRHHSDYQQADINPAKIEKSGKIYVPIYSDIYYRDSKHTFSLTVTLSIRNVTFRDTVYVFSIDYFNSKGQKVRTYNDKTILLKPMESIEFVVEDKDDTGGVGANFVVGWGGDSDIQKPFVQGIMIGTMGQQGISFTTDGLEIE